jgi:hypothetical protein
MVVGVAAAGIGSRNEMGKNPRSATGLSFIFVNMIGWCLDKVH